MFGLPMALTMASHFLFVREAIMMSVKTSLFCATLWAATVATPPAPMISTLPILRSLVTSYGLLSFRFLSVFKVGISVGHKDVIPLQELSHVRGVNAVTVV